MNSFTDQTFLFIVGCQRSGTTLFKDILGFVPSVFSIADETAYFRNFYGRYGDLNSYENREAILKDFMGTYVFSTSGVEKGKFEQTIQAVGDLNYAIFFSSFANLSAKSITNTKPKIIVEKTPCHTFYMNTILNTYPTAKFIAIIRDPFAVISSNIKYGIARLTLLHSRKLMVLATLYEWINHYREIMRQKQQLAETQLYILDYKNLVSNTRRILYEMQDFLGCELNESDITFSIKQEPLNKYQKYLSRKEINIIASALQDYPDISAIFAEKIPVVPLSPIYKKLARYLYNIEFQFATNLPPKYKKYLKRIRGDKVLY